MSLVYFTWIITENVQTKCLLLQNERTVFNISFLIKVIAVLIRHFVTNKFSPKHGWIDVQSFAWVTCVEPRDTTDCSLHCNAFCVSIKVSTKKHRCNYIIVFHLPRTNKCPVWIVAFTVDCFFIYLFFIKYPWKFLKQMKFTHIPLLRAYDHTSDLNFHGISQRIFCETNN